MAGVGDAVVHDSVVAVDVVGHADDRNPPHGLLHRSNGGVPLGGMWTTREGKLSRVSLAGIWRPAPSGGQSYPRAIKSGRRGAGRPTVAGHTTTAVRLAPRQHI